MKWIASLSMLAILVIAMFATVPKVGALPNYKTPTPAPSGTPISAGTTPHP